MRTNNKYDMTKYNQFTHIMINYYTHSSSNSSVRQIRAHTLELDDEISGAQISENSAHLDFRQNIGISDSLKITELENIRIFEILKVICQKR